ncbi:MAG: hypothetical protein M0R22_00010 [Dehalococcoidia bacterium]|jgi:hypothetical protein|nr:hypothetical protein [Dehalococcoidia bacterium]
MTRQEIVDTYTITERGTISNPGKFEGEMLYVVAFYERALEGFSDRYRQICDSESVEGFNVTAADRREFPELSGKRTVNLYYRSDGFVIEVNRFR